MARAPDPARQLGQCPPGGGVPCHADPSRQATDLASRDIAEGLRQGAGVRAQPLPGARHGSRAPRAAHVGQGVRLHAGQSRAARDAGPGPSRRQGRAGPRHLGRLPGLSRARVRPRRSRPPELRRVGARRPQLRVPLAGRRPAEHHGLREGLPGLPRDPASSRTTARPSASSRSPTRSSSTTSGGRTSACGRTTRRATGPSRTARGTRRRRRPTSPGASSTSTTAG